MKYSIYIVSTKAEQNMNGSVINRYQYGTILVPFSLYEWLGFHNGMDIDKLVGTACGMTKEEAIALRAIDLWKYSLFLGGACFIMTIV